MALFGRKKKIEENTEEKKELPRPVASAESGIAEMLPTSAERRGTFHIKTASADAILRARVTEKGSLLAESNTYVFDVARNASKRMLAEAVLHVYKVKPLSVRMLKVPSKQVFMKGKNGRTAAGKKAYITLQKGDKIEFV